jgi:hypothetical protein
MVPGEPPQTCGRTAADPQCEAPGPLPILRTTDELQEHLEVLSGGLPHLAKVAQSSNAWEPANVGELYRTSSVAILCCFLGSHVLGTVRGVAPEELAAWKSARWGL